MINREITIKKGKVGLLVKSDLKEASAAEFSGASSDMLRALHPFAASASETCHNYIFSH